MGLDGGWGWGGVLGRGLEEGFGGGATRNTSPFFKALLKTTDIHQKADSVHTEVRTRSTLKNRIRRGQTDKLTKGHCDY